MAKIIEVTVSLKGETRVQTKGIIGSDCLQASKFLEQSLGISTADQKTGEFYATNQADQQIRQ